MLPAGAARARRARRLQHARLAAAEVPRPRAGQLGGAARRDARPARRCTRWRPSPTPAPSSRSRPVPILPDDTAREVFDKVTVAAELTLVARAAGAARRRPRRVMPNDLARGSYFGGRKPEDGRIDWTQPRAAGPQPDPRASRRPIPAPSRHRRPAPLRHRARAACGAGSALAGSARRACTSCDNARSRRLRRRPRASRSTSCGVQPTRADSRCVAPAEFAPAQLKRSRHS